MKRYLYGESVQGASHKRTGKMCQDSHRIDFNKDIAIIGVADGHGSDSCPYSKTGSVIAVNVFCSVMSAYYNNFRKSRNGMKLLMRFLNREGELKVARTIEREWKRRVYKQHLNRKRDIPYDSAGNPDKEALYKMYGTTLLGVVISKDFVFSFQLGDGDICCVTKENLEYLIEPDKLLGVETHSLCKNEAWKKAHSTVHLRNCVKKKSMLYWISSDGFGNSYRTRADFEKACTDYFELIDQYGFEVIEDNLNTWLNETSEGGCGDDTTAVFAYFA